ncbi:PQQ-binding-like beta-propeller repeat protein [Leptospira sp. 96542]|nr:PQQ-binding-like beta-propeller repeat protein [Leptospira sp. 96542]
MAFVYKELKPFSPKVALKVDETFRFTGKGSMEEDTLAELRTESMDPKTVPGAGFLNFRTKTHITSGVLGIEGKNQEEFLLVTNHKGEVILLEAVDQTVKPVWALALPGAIYRTPIQVGDNVFIVTKQGLIAAIAIKYDDKGKILPGEIFWQRNIGLTVFSKLVSTGRILIVGTISGIHAYDCYTASPGETGNMGKKVWEHKMEGLVGSPTIDGGNIYIGSEDKHLYALRYGGEGANKSWSIKTDGPIRSKPHVSLKGNFILFGSLDGFVYCADKTDGRVLWTFPTRSPVHSDIVSFLLGNDEFFLFGNDDGSFFCLNAYGKQQWVFKTNGRVRSEALIQGDQIYFGSEDNFLYGLNLINGSLYLKYNTDGNINGKPFIWKNRLYVGSTDSFLHGLYI